MQSLFEEYGGAVLSVIGALGIIAVALTLFQDSPVAVALGNIINFYT